MERRAEFERTTRETQIRGCLQVDGTGKASVGTGIGFVDHMMTAMARHGYLDLDLTVCGDLEVDAHHTVEDIGLALGAALKTCVGNKAGIQRFGWCLLPMDDALVRVALDLGGRPYLVYSVDLAYPEVGGIPCILFREFFQALANSAGMNLHIARLHGDEPHHVFEAVFKAVGKALDQAVSLDPRCDGVPSTKGVLTSAQ